ncbi:MAG: family 10 glycosylhydrolase [Chitinophagaceae bacterium]|nr:family 10 glycosylhydrolase [Chitinophagaceae bacterium]
MNRRNFFTGMLLLTLSGMSLVSCKKEAKEITRDWGGGDPGTPGTDKSKKPRIVWIDAAANFPDYANNKTRIGQDVKKIKDAGLTAIVLDVRPTMGDVLFQTSQVDQVHKLDYWGDAGYGFYERTETWDYLQAFIDACRTEGLKIYAAINTFVAGNKYSYGLGQQGLLFRDNTKKDWASTMNHSFGLINVLDLDATTDPNNDYGTKFLNPHNDAVQQFLLNMIGDLAKYNVDGIILDRARFNNFQTDFSPQAKSKFEAYIGETVANFPNDVVVPGTSYYPLPGTMPKYFKQWMAFRAKTIHDFMEKARTKVKSVNSKMEFGVYVGGWYSTYYDVGVNWASPDYNTAQFYPSWANSDYRNYGYGDLMDITMIGAYAPTTSIYGSTEWTVEGFCKRAKTMIGNNIVIGGPDVGNGSGWTGGGKPNEVSQTVDAAMGACDGYFIFDLIHIKKYNYWSAIKKGVDDYLAKP